MRCSTKQGPYQCDKEAGHVGECETVERPSSRMRGGGGRGARIEAALRALAETNHRVAAAMTARRFNTPDVVKHTTESVRASLEKRAMTDEQIETACLDAFELAAEALKP